MGGEENPQRQRRFLCYENKSQGVRPGQRAQGGGKPPSRIPRLVRCVCRGEHEQETRHGRPRAVRHLRPQCRSHNPR